MTSDNYPRNQHHRLYKAVTADLSQVCDGRPIDSLAKLRGSQLKEGDGRLQRKDSSVSSNTNSGFCPDAGTGGHCFAPNSYQPISSSKHGGFKAKPQKTKKILTDAPDDVNVSPDDVNALSKVADWFQNSLDLNRRPPKMPFDGVQKAATQENSITPREDTCIEAVESSPTRRSYVRSASQQINKDASLCLPLPVGKPQTHSPKRDVTNAHPHMTGYYTPPSKIRMHKKFMPQHRSPQVNDSVSSILKMPKYSRRLSLDLYSDMESTNLQRRRSSHTRSESMPPIGPLPDLFFNSRKYSITSDSNNSNESNNDSDEWVPKGVDFKPTAELYFFRKK